MARVSKVESCMICEQMPCECNKTTSKPKKLAAPKVKVQPVVEASDDDDLVSVIAAPKPSAMAAMKAAAVPARGSDSPVDAGGGRQPAEQSDDDKADFARAIRALGDMLHPTERVRYVKILSETPPLPERRERWLSRRNRSTSQS